MNLNGNSILIVMEGQATEPNYFAALRDFLQVSLENDAPLMTLWPEPASTVIIQDSNRPKGSRRSLIDLNPTRDVLGKISGTPPLSWVNAGKEKLRIGAFSEVWVVFDHDNHPMRKEAFEEAAIPVDGKKVHIAFASRSFEYFMLLHFEQLYHKFDLTECKGASHGCVDDSDGTACAGRLCINAYARIKGCWQESKRKVDRTKIWETLINCRYIGLANAHWLRKESDRLHTDTPIWDRNPYVTTDALVKRLTGNWLELEKPQKLKLGIEILLNANGVLTFRNIVDHAVIIPKDSVQRIDLQGNLLEVLGDRTLLHPTNSTEIELSRYLDEPCYFVLAFEGKQVKFIL